MRTKLDPVTLEVIRNALPAIANEMAVDLQRTSYNMMIYEVRDFCTALVDVDGELISQNVGGVSHFVADLGVIITDAVKRYGRKGFKPGDVLITNHQAVAGQHLNNVVIYLPYFFKGELLAFAMVRAHWIDVGGTSTGFGAGPEVPDPWQEGLQLDQLKIYDGGRLDQTLYRVIRDNIRFPESSLGDMNSQIASCKLGIRRLDELVRKYGRDTLLRAIARIFDETERKCRNFVARLADGVYEAESFFDDDGVTPDERVRIHAKVTVKSGNMTIDLSGCSSERKAAGERRLVSRARGDHPRGQHHDGALPGADGGLEHLRSDGGRDHHQLARLRHARQDSGRASRAPRRLGGVLRRSSEIQATLRGAEHRGRRLGRPAFRGRRIGHRLRLPGGRAQRLDRGHRDEMPGAGKGARAAARFRGCGQVPRRPRHRHGGAQLRRRKMELRAREPPRLSRVGPVGRRAGRKRRLLPAQSR